MIRFILKTSDPDDMPWAYDLARDAVGYEVGTEYAVSTGTNPTRKALVRVNPKSISVHVVRRNSP